VIGSGTSKTSQTAKVILFNDSFINYNEPCVGIAALRVMGNAGAQEWIPEASCCGVAGAFGYEREHYDISLQICEMRLFPAIRRAAADALIAASGTSCRRHAAHATGHKAVHLAEALAGTLAADEQVT
jgi:Fe-S oxidoreductase